MFAIHKGFWGPKAGTFAALLLPALLVTSANAQVIDTVVGNGAAGFSGDNGPALQAGLNNQRGLVLDAFGNLYIADTENNRVRRVDRETGAIRTVAGIGIPGSTGDGGPATAAELGFPVALALDSGGNLYICGADSLVRRVNAKTGIITTVAGGGTLTGENVPATQAQLSAPSGLALDSSGDLYISDSNNNRVRRIKHGSANIETIAGTGLSGDSGDGGPAINARVSLPTGLAFDPLGNLHIAEGFGSSVRRIDRKTGIITTVAGHQSAGFSGDGGPATQAAFSFLVALTFDPVGNFYVADATNERIRRIDRKTGIVTTIAGSGPHGTGTGGFGGDGGPATLALLNEPSGLAFDQKRGLFISDPNNNRVRLVKIDADDFRGAPVSDGFNKPVLNTKLWTFVNPVGDGTYSLNGSELLLTAPAGSNHDPAFGGINNSVRVVQPIENGDFQVEARFDSIPHLQYQFQGILVGQDAANYLRFQLGSTGTSMDVDGSTILSGAETTQFSSKISLPSGTASLWLRVLRSEDTWTVSWSADGISYHSAGSFTQALIATDIGPFAGNYNDTPGAAPAFTAAVDYFRNKPTIPVISESDFTVDAMNNIYGAGHASPPGDGTLPPSVSFAAGPGQILQFSSVSGTWFETNFTPLGVDGSAAACPPFTGIHVNGSNGIASYDATDFCNALVGVFLDDSEPAGTPPPGLRFYETDKSQGGTQTGFESLAPAIGQVFFIGDGLRGTGTGSEQVFNVPKTATRLFLGQADACNFNGDPNCYFDNGGSVQATFTITKKRPHEHQSTTR